MKKNSALLLMLIVFACVTVAFTSCDGSQEETGGSQAEGPDETITVYDDQTFYWSGSEIAFISASSSACRAAAEELLNCIDEKIIGEGGKVFTSSIFIARDYENEIIIGCVEDKEISKKAYALLDRIDSSSPLTESRYLVYAEGGKIAFAFDENAYSTIQSVGMIVERFINEHIGDDGTLLLNKGVVMSGVIDLISEQEQIDREYVNGIWEEYRAKWYNTYGSDDLYWAFRTYYSMFSDELLVWWANLYDPGTGCFYSTPSGRDYEGFLPNPEATCQIFDCISNSGVFDTMPGGVSRYLPKYLQAQMVYYCKSIQDPNGYYYLPQLGKEYTDGYAITRRGRDILMCTNVIGLFGEQPTYTTPAGVSGDGVTAEQYWESTGLPESLKPVIPGLVAASNEKITDKINVSLSSAVSRAVAVSDVATVSTDESTAYMNSYESFIEYLDGLDIDGSPYGVGNELNSTYTQIDQYSKRVAARDGKYSDPASVYNGMTIAEILIKWLDDHVNDYGLFGDDGDTSIADVKFANTNGMMKIITVYNHFNAAFPKPLEAADGILTGIVGDEPSTGNICEVYNCWYALSGLIHNVKYYIKDSDLSKSVLNRISEVMGEKGPDAVLNSYAKQSGYMKPHGTFSHAYVGGATSHQGGLPVGLGLDEGNVDAIGFGSCFIVDFMCECIGVDMVPIYTESDWMRFVDTMLGLVPVIKYEYDGFDLPESFDFEDGEMPERNFRAALSDAYADVVRMERNGESGYVLKINKEASHTPTSLVMNSFLIKKSEANMIYYSVDILVDDITQLSQLQLQFGSSSKPDMNDMQVLFILIPESQYTGASLKFLDFYNGQGAPGGRVDIGADVGRWFNLRLELYPSDDLASFRYQVYVNDTLAFVSSNVYSPTMVSGVNDLIGVDKFNHASLAINRDFAGSFYFDNVSFGQAKKELTVTELGTPDGFDPEAVGALGGEFVGDDYPPEDYNPEIESFDKMPEDLWISQANGITAGIVEKDGSNTLLVDKTVPDFTALIYSSVNKTEKDANAVEISFDMLLENLTGVGGIEPYVQGSGKDYFLPYLRITGTSDGSSVQVFDYNGGGSTVDTGAVVGRWATFTIKYYPVLEKYELYVNDSFVLTGSHLRTGTEYPQISEVNQLRIVIASGNVGDYYFDNMSIKHLKLELPDDIPEGGGGDTPSAPPDEDSTSVTFESGAIPSTVKASGGISSVVDKGDGTKALKLEKPMADSRYNVRLEYSTVSYKENDANVSVIGFDIMTNNVSEQGNIELWLFEGSTTKYLPFFTYMGTEDGSPIQIRDLYAGKNGQKDSGITLGKWVSVQIRYYSNRAVWELYVDGELIFTGDGVKDGGAAPVFIDHIMLNMSQSLSADVYIDNLYIVHVAEERDGGEGK